MSSHQIMDINGNMRFGVVPGTVVSEHSFDVFRVHTAQINSSTMKQIKEYAAPVCTAILYAPSMELVKEFAKIGFGEPKDYEFMVTMERDKNVPTPNMIALLDTRLLKRLALTHSGGWFRQEQAEMTFIALYGITRQSRLWKEAIKAGVQWGILEYRHASGYRITEWVARSLKDDFVDAQARQQGHE